MEGNKKHIVLLLFCFLLFVPVATAKKPAPQPALSVERQQQFSYYWYAAKQAITEERYSDALLLLTFCEQINPNDGKTLDFLGSMYDALNKTDKAKDYYRRAFQADPHDQWYHYSEVLLKEGGKENVKLAQQVLEQAHQLNPKDEDLLEYMLRLYGSTEQWKKVLQTQDEMDAIRGYDAYSALNRANAWTMLGKPKKALGAVEKYLELEPTNVRFMLYRVDLLERCKAKPEQLYAEYDRVLTLAPGNLSVLNNYAYLLATRGGDLKKAERMSQLTIREEPNNAVYLDTYGWILHLQGQDDLALFYLRKALDYASSAEIRQVVQLHAAAVLRAKQK